MLLSGITVTDRLPDNEFPQLPAGSLRPEKPLYVVIKLGPLAKKAKLQWRWFNPRGEAVRLSPWLEVNRQDRNLVHIIAWDRLPADASAEMPGRWTVALFAADRFLGQCEFDIE